MNIIIEILIAVIGLGLCYLAASKRVTDNKHVNTVLLFIGFWVIAAAAYMAIF